MEDLSQRLQRRSAGKIAMPPQAVTFSHGGRSEGPPTIEGEFKVSYSESPMPRNSVAPSVEIHFNNPPLGAGVLKAAWRQGLKDLQNVVLNPFPQHVAQHEEPGSIANPTQIEVNDMRLGDPQAAARKEALKNLKEEMKGWAPAPMSSPESQPRQETKQHRGLSM